MEIIKSKSVTKLHFDSTAQDYDNSHDGKFVRCMYQEILNRVKSISAEKILDLGCGNGNVIDILRKNLSDARYYGLDISENMIKEAKKRLGDEVSLCIGDSESLPFDENTFDLIICNASFHHYPNPQKAVSEMRRVLKPNGIVILGDPTTKFRFLTAIINWLLKFNNSGDVKIWNKKEIISLFEQNGFCIDHWSYINHKTFMFNAELKKF